MGFLRFFKNKRNTIDKNDKELINHSIPLFHDTKIQDDLSYKTKQRNLVFSIFLPDLNYDEPVYCCIMHHPLRSAWVTPGYYPVDDVHIVYNGLVEEQYIYETEKEKWKIILSDVRNIEDKDLDIINIEGQWDKKISYRPIIYDADESWDFVFSKEMINENIFLNEYVHQYGNVYSRESDLNKSKERDEEQRLIYECYRRESSEDDEKEMFRRPTEL